MSFACEACHPVPRRIGRCRGVAKQRWSTDTQIDIQGHVEISDVALTWSGWPDSNRRPLRPEQGQVPLGTCAFAYTAWSRRWGSSGSYGTGGPPSHETPP